MANKPSTTDVYQGPGNRYRHNKPEAPAGLVDALRQFEPPDISDQLNRLFAMSANIRNLVGDGQICGPACTVTAYPGDNLMVHKALDIARPGDVVVVSCAGSTTTAVIGDMIAQKAVHRGICGYVIDGMVRDLPGIQRVGLPVFARGVTPVGPLHRGPGEINYPVACGGVVVNPGDIICGGPDGVVVVPLDFAEEVIERLRARADRLKDYIADLQRGDFTNAWVDKLLGAAGCVDTSR